MSFSFPRSSRLLKKPQYDFVFQSAKRIGTRFITVLYRKNELEVPRLGLIVSKKSAKRAHDRNRFKRVTRESFRLLQHRLPFVDIVVMSRAHIAEVENKYLFDELEYVWKRIAKDPL